MGFFSRRRNRIIEEEITNALLYSEGFHDTKIHWEAFERFAQEHGGKTDHKADGGHDTEFEMVTNGIEVKVMAFRYPTDGSTSIRVRTLAEVEKEADKFAADFNNIARGGSPKDEVNSSLGMDDDEFLKQDLSQLEAALNEQEESEDEDEDEDEFEEEEVDFDVAEDSEVEDEIRPANGKHIDYYENGQKSWEGSYKDGSPDGKCIKYYENGQKESEWTFKDWPNQDGKATWWYVDGQKQKQGTYKDGLSINTWTFWYENGQKSEQREYKNGKRHGKETWWQPDGKLMGKALWKDGKEVG